MYAKTDGKLYIKDDAGAETDLTGSGLLNNYAASAAPTVTDDSSAGYSVGSRWIDTTNDVEYVCVDASVGAAVWLLTSPAVDFFVGSFDPAGSIDLGSLAVANAAHLYPIQVNRPMVAAKAYTRIGVQSGNIDAGIYDDAGNRLASAGSTACPAAAVTVSLTFTAPVTLYPGRRYWVAIAADNTTVTFVRSGTAAAPTIPGQVTSYRVTTSFPLPASLVLGGGQIAVRYGIWAAAS